VAVEYLRTADPSNQKETDITSLNGIPHRTQTRQKKSYIGGKECAGPYSEDGERGGRVSGDAEAVGLDEEVVLAALGEARVAVAHVRALGAVAAELAADQSGQGQRRGKIPLAGGERCHRTQPLAAALQKKRPSKSRPKRRHFPRGKCSGQRSRRGKRRAGSGITRVALGFGGNGDAMPSATRLDLGEFGERAVNRETAKGDEDFNQLIRE